MTNDLVKQAREAADSCKLSTEHMWLVSAMADHIEKLEAALRFYAFHGGDIARKALEQKNG